MKIWGRHICAPPRKTNMAAGNNANIWFQYHHCSLQRPLCCGEAGERKKKRARYLPIVPRALSIFPIFGFFLGIPSGSLCGAERYCHKFDQ